MLDLETTGLRSRTDRICEVAVIRTTLGDTGPPRTWQTLVHPGVAMPRVAEGIHGLSDASLAGAPPFAAVLPVLRERLRGAVLVAHNASFDTAFLAAEAQRLDVASPVPPNVLCTLQLARRLYGFYSCSLAALSTRLEIPQPQAHRALADAETALAVLRGLVLGLGDAAPATMQQLLERVAGMRRGETGYEALVARIRATHEAGASLTIDYTARLGEGPLTRRRTITPTRLRLPHVEAWCHLRDARRVFHVKRIVQVVDD